MKTIPVLNLPTPYQVTPDSPLRKVDLYQIMKEDRQVLTKVIPMSQAVWLDEGLLQEILEGRSNNLVVLVPPWANSLVMDHRMDLLSLLDGSNHPHHSST